MSYKWTNKSLCSLLLLDVLFLWLNNIIRMPFEELFHLLHHSRSFGSTGNLAKNCANIIYFIQDCVDGKVTYFCTNWSKGYIYDAFLTKLRLAQHIKNIIMIVPETW